MSIKRIIIFTLVMLAASGIAFAQHGGGHGGGGHYNGSGDNQWDNDSTGCGGGNHWNDGDSTGSGDHWCDDDSLGFGGGHHWGDGDSTGHGGGHYWWANDSTMFDTLLVTGHLLISSADSLDHPNDGGGGHHHDSSYTDRPIFLLDVDGDDAGDYLLAGFNHWFDLHPDFAVPEAGSILNITGIAPITDHLLQLLFVLNVEPQSDNPDGATLSVTPVGSPREHQLNVLNYPNPFNPSTMIEFNLEQAAQVKLSVFNIRGNQVADLVSDRLTEGQHVYQFDAGPLSAGTYIYVLQLADQQSAGKMIYLK